VADLNAGIIKIINNIICNFQNELKDVPVFITKFFNNIQHDMDNIRNKKEKKSFLEKFDNEEYFLYEMKIIIQNSIHDFLGIEEDSDSEDKSDSEEESEGDS